MEILSSTEGPGPNHTTPPATAAPKKAAKPKVKAKHKAKPAAKAKPKTVHRARQPRAKWRDDAVTRDVLQTFRVTVDENNKIMTLARKAGYTSLSDYFRDVSLGKRQA